jgi:glucose/arabinose dehydrogenase
MRGNTTKGQHFGSRIVLTMKVICISQQENAAEFVNPQTSLVTTENLPPEDDGRIPADNPFVGKTGAKEAIYSYGHRNPQGLAKPTLQSYLGSNTDKGRRNQHHKKGANYGWPVVTYGIDYDGTTISDKPKSQVWKIQSTIGFLLSLLRNDLCNR